jgi:hypothetical protein
MRERYWIERITEHSAGGRGRFEFGNDIEAGAKKGGWKISDGRGGFHSVFKSGFGQNGFAVFDFSSTRFQDAVEDGAGVDVSRHGYIFVC